jgi:hypothetical protein
MRHVVPSLALALGLCLSAPFAHGETDLDHGDGTEAIEQGTPDPLRELLGTAFDALDSSVSKTASDAEIVRALEAALQHLMMEPRGLYQKVQRFRRLLGVKYEKRVGRIFDETFLIREPDLSGPPPRRLPSKTSHELAPKGFVGPFGMSRMQIFNETGKPVSYSGYFSPAEPGDEKLTDPKAFVRQRERVWMPITFDKVDQGSPNPKLLIPTPASVTSAELSLPAGTKFNWMKRGPGPTVSYVSVDGRQIEPGDRDYEVVFDSKAPSITIRKR